MNWLIIIIVFLYLIFLPAGLYAQQEFVTVGSFNLEWLGHANKIRSQDHIIRLARYIRALEVDVLCCQEISTTGDATGNSVPDWQDLLDNLGEGYQSYVGSTGGSQKLAIIWDTSTVEISDPGEVVGIQRTDVPNSTHRTFPRIPFTAYVKAKGGGIDFRLITIHLYFSDNRARYQEAEELKDWLSDYLTGSNDKDVLLISTQSRWMERTLTGRILRPYRT